MPRFPYPQPPRNHAAAATSRAPAALPPSSGRPGLEMMATVLPSDLLGVVDIESENFGFRLFYCHRTPDCTESADDRRRKLGVEQEFPVAFAAQNWRLDPFEPRAPEFYKRSLYPGHRRKLRRLHRGQFLPCPPLPCPLRTAASPTRQSVGPVMPRDQHMRKHRGSPQAAPASLR
jgi:hypothetical protein